MTRGNIEWLQKCSWSGIIFISFLTIAMLTGCTNIPSINSGKITGSDELVQGWSMTERLDWERISQGSRLLPLIWFKALEQPYSAKLFTNSNYFTNFGYIRSTTPNGLPLGFAIDRQSDIKFQATKLRWYDGQTGNTGRDSEPWIGMTCAACHMSIIRHKNQSIHVYGGPSSGDLQSFVDALNETLVATQNDPAKWERFTSRVLTGRDTQKNREMLRKAFSSLLDWQLIASKTNQTTSRYGYGRVDALGRLYNKMTQFAGVRDFRGNPPSAPVSYPFLWEVYKQKNMQWNGAARNTFVWRRNQSIPDLGAYGRNVGQAIGVFGEVVVDPNDNSGFGLVSSLNSKNIIKFEKMISILRPPKWPASFGAIDRDKTQRGKAIFANKCRNCHLTQDVQELGKATERMIKFSDTSPENLTDVTMACNAFAYEVPTGGFEGIRINYLKGATLGAKASGFDFLYAIVNGAIMRNLKDLVLSVPGSVLEGSLRRLASKPRIVGNKKKISLHSSERECLTTDSEILSYKARPLDGIWATAPYLHNGSVPTLYHLLLPAKERPKFFYLGGREFDSNLVGFKTKPSSKNNFRFTVKNPNGSYVKGNGNMGHEYGVADLTEEDRNALLEYMKTL